MEAVHQRCVQQEFYGLLFWSSDEGQTPPIAAGRMGGLG